MQNLIAYPPLALPTLQQWWTKNSQATTPLAIKYMAQCESTNAQLYSSARQHNTLLVTEQQSHGKGQFERTWVSQSGDLIFSVGLLLHTSHLPALSLRIGLALTQVFKQHDLNVRLKWANDVIASHPDTGQRGKLAGILVQSTATAQPNTLWVVVGVGINVAARLLPQNISPSVFVPIGLAQLSSKWMSPPAGEREALLMQLVDTILVHIETISVQGSLANQWNPHDLWYDHAMTLTDAQGNEHTGIGAGINDLGEYQLLSNNTLKSFHSGQLRPEKTSS